MLQIVFLVTVLAHLPGSLEVSVEVGPVALPGGVPDLPGLPQSTEATCVSTSTGGGATVQTSCTGSGGGGN